MQTQIDRLVPSDSKTHPRNRRDSPMPEKLDTLLGVEQVFSNAKRIAREVSPSAA